MLLADAMDIILNISDTASLRDLLGKPQPADASRGGTPRLSQPVKVFADTADTSFRPALLLLTCHLRHRPRRIRIE